MPSKVLKTSLFFLLFMSVAITVKYFQTFSYNRLRARVLSCIQLSKLKKDRWFDER